MSTQAQIDANRANAQKSTGPTTDDGKARSSQNHLTHGFYTKHHVILAGEDSEEYEALLDAYLGEFQPRTPSERFLIHEIAEAQWKLARIGRYEQRALDAAGLDPDPDLLKKYDQLTTSAQRAWRKAFDTLHLIRRVRKAKPLYLLPHPKIEETNPIQQEEYRPAPFREPDPATLDDDQPRKLPYDIAKELKQLKRFHPNFDPRRSRRNISPELKAYLNDRKNLELVLNAMVFL